MERADPSDLHIWSIKDDQFQRTFLSVIQVIGNVIMISRCFCLLICQLAKALTNNGKIFQSGAITLDFELTALQSDNFQLVLVLGQEETDSNHCEMRNIRTLAFS